MPDDLIEQVADKIEQIQAEILEAQRELKNWALESTPKIEHLHRLANRLVYTIDYEGDKLDDADELFVQGDNVISAEGKFIELGGAAYALLEDAQEVLEHLSYLTAPQKC